MPDVTSVFGWPVPVLTDSPNVPSDVTALANAIEGTITAGAANVHACFAYRSVSDGDTSGIGDSTWVAIPMPSNSIDTDGYHSTSVNNNRITIPTGLGGYYLIGATAHFSASTLGTRRGIGIDTNNSGNFYAMSMQVLQSGAFNSSNAPTLNIVGFQSLADGDYVQLSAFQDTGSTQVIKQTFTNVPNLWLVRLPFS